MVYFLNSSGRQIGSSLLLGASTLLRQEDSLDIGQNSALGDGHASQKLVELLVIPYGQLQMSGDDARLLVVPGSIAGQLKNLGCQVFHDGCHVNWSPCTHPLGIISFPEKPMDPANRKLEACPARPRLGLPFHLATLSTARHTRV